MRLSFSAHPPAPIDQSGLGQEPLASKASGRFSVVLWPAVTSFFTSMSPSYTPKSLANSFSHGQPPSGPGKQPFLPSAVQGVGLASKVISCWLPQVGLAGEIISSACSSFSLAHQLGTASRKSDGSASSSGEKQTPPGHGQVLSNAFSGAGAAALGLIAVDSLAGAAAEELQTTPSSMPDGLPTDPSLTFIENDGSSDQTGSGEGAPLLRGDAVDELSGDTVDEFSGDAVDELSGDAVDEFSGKSGPENEFNTHTLVSGAAGPTAQAPTAMASKLPGGEFPNQAPSTTDSLVITPSQALEHSVSHTTGVPVESPVGEATQHPGNSSLAFYSPASSSPVGTVVSTEAFPGPTPSPPLAPPLPPGNLMALNATHMAPPLGQAVFSFNSSHMALNGTSMAPVTQMSMASPASIFPGALPTSAAPAASAALSLAGGLSPLTLIGLSVGIPALMSGIGALYGRYADDKKEQ